MTKDQVFSVRNGMIICKGEPLGFIQTDKTFTNFKLEVQYRWAPGTKPGNSGYSAHQRRASPPAALHRVPSSRRATPAILRVPPA